jgi:hypothetical protein
VQISPNPAAWRVRCKDVRYALVRPLHKVIPKKTIVDGLLHLNVSHRSDFQRSYIPNARQERRVDTKMIKKDTNRPPDKQAVLVASGAEK